MSDLSDTLETIFRDVVPVLGHMGVEVVEAEPGRVTLRLPHRAEVVNHVGSVYAGVLFSFLETAGGAIVLTSLDVSRWIPVLVESAIRYVRPATSPIEATLSLDAGERDALAAALAADPKHRWTITVGATDDSGKLVCEADLTYRFRDLGRP